MEINDDLVTIPHGDRFLTGYYDQNQQFVTIAIRTRDPDGDINTRLGESVPFSNGRAGIMPKAGETRTGTIAHFIVQLGNPKLPTFVEIEGEPSPLRLFYFASSQKNEPDPNQP